MHWPPVEFVCVEISQQQGSGYPYQYFIHTFLTYLALK